MFRILALTLLAAGCAPVPVAVYHPRPHHHRYHHGRVIVAPPHPHVVIGPRWR